MLDVGLSFFLCGSAQKALKHRRVKHYGFEFRYDNNNVDKEKPLSAGELPIFCLFLFLRDSKKAIYTIYCLPSKMFYTNAVRNHTISCLTQVLVQFAIILIHRDSYRLQKKKIHQIIFNYIVQRGLCVLY